jgi:hypothetical protein
MPAECYREILAQSDGDEVRRGRSWYADAKKEIEKIAVDTMESLETCTGVVAVLSPMVEWNLNLRSARRFIKSKGKVKGAGFAGNYRKAKGVLKGDLSVIRGPKVSRFYETLLNPSFPEPVIDTQMIAAFYRGKAYRDDFKIISQSDKRLGPIRQAVKDIAAERGEKVAATQATIWMTFKRLNGAYANQLKLWK